MYPLQNSTIPLARHYVNQLMGACNGEVNRGRMHLTLYQPKIHIFLMIETFSFMMSYPAGR